MRPMNRRRWLLISVLLAAPLPAWAQQRPALPPPRVAPRPPQETYHPPVPRAIYRPPRDEHGARDAPAPPPSSPSAAPERDAPVPPPPPGPPWWGYLLYLTPLPVLAGLWWLRARRPRW